MFTVQFKRCFQAAHRLSEYEGKCSRIHGHNFYVEVEIAVDHLGEDGFVVEWDHIRTVIDRFDHRLILRDGDPYANALPAEWVYAVPSDPTTEFMAGYLATEIAQAALAHNTRCWNVDAHLQLRETDSIMAYGQASAKR